MRLVFGAVAAAAVAGVCGPSLAQSRAAPPQVPPDVAGVTVTARRPLPAPVGPRLELYEQRDLGGAGVILVQAERSLLTRGFADRARSVRAFGSWEVCDGPDFRGLCRRVEGDVGFLGEVGLSERVASARPVTP